jgi:hypothetical protein
MINMAKYLPGLPSIVYDNSSWFWYISNILELDIVKTQTREKNEEVSRGSK